MSRREQSPDRALASRSAGTPCHHRLWGIREAAGIRDETGEELRQGGNECLGADRRLASLGLWLRSFTPVVPLDYWRMMPRWRASRRRCGGSAG